MAKQSIWMDNGYNQDTTKRHGSKHNISRDQYQRDSLMFAPDKKSTRKLTDDQVREIRIAYDKRLALLSQLAEIPTQEHFCQKFGMSKMAVQKIAHGLTYKEIR